MTKWYIWSESQEGYALADPAQDPAIRQRIRMGFAQEIITRLTETCIVAEYTPWAGVACKVINPLGPEEIRNLAIGGLAPIEPAGEAWLIERGQPERTYPTVWFAGGEIWTPKWTTDANKAVKFASREDCEAAIYSRSVPERMAFGRAAAHKWLDVTPLPDPEADES